MDLLLVAGCLLVMGALLMRRNDLPEVGNAARLATLDPSFRHRVESFLDACDRVGITIVITSARRSPTSNADAGGKPTSLHLAGRAIDIRSRDFDESERAIVVELANDADLAVFQERDPPHFHLSPLGAEFGPGFNVER